MRSDMQKGKNMMSFKKYSSIDNSFNRQFMECVMTEMPTDLQYVIQEKVHGANTSFLCDGVEVLFAKRTSVLLHKYRIQRVIGKKNHSNFCYNFAPNFLK